VKSESHSIIHLMSIGYSINAWYINNLTLASTQRPGGYIILSLGRGSASEVDVISGKGPFCNRGLGITMNLGSGKYPTAFP
jgi:hypothetical protein